MTIKNSQKMILVISEGLSITNATLLAATVNRGFSTVSVECKRSTCSGTDIKGLLKMDIKKGDGITITAQGPDSEDILRRIEVLFRNNIENAFYPVYAHMYQRAIA